MYQNRYKSKIDKQDKTIEKKHCPYQYNLQGCVAVVDVVAVGLV